MDLISPPFLLWLFDRVTDTFARAFEICVGGPGAAALADAAGQRMNPQLDPVRLQEMPAARDQMPRNLDMLR